ncbi:MAG: YitT family protein [Catonella sp.]|nr:YitT family protein [Catonella sp.]MDY6356230.1 YitT family protein [Catonella sp.]
MPDIQRQITDPESGFNRNKRIFDILFIVVGTFLMAASVNTVYDPMKMGMGGFGGLAVIVKEIGARIGVSIPTWLTNAALNIPVFIVAYFLLGKNFILRTLFGAIMFEAWLFIIPSYDLCGGDHLLAIIVGGLMDGGGVGLVFLTNSTTGGTDMLAAITHRFIKHRSVPDLMMFFDGCVVVLGAFVFGYKNALYSAITIFVLTKISDGILEGLKFAKMVYIISDKYEEIANKIMADMNRGVTGLNARGMYTKDDKNMLFVVVNKKEIVGIKEIVAKIDKSAFVIVADVAEVFGEGFIEYDQTSAIK